MNVSLQGARRQSRLDWDVLDQRNQRAQAVPRKIFMATVVVILAYLAWTSFSG